MLEVDEDLDDLAQVLRAEPLYEGLANLLRQ